MADWPAALPQNLLSQGFSLTPFDNAVPIDVESGEPLSRLRFTGDLNNVQGSVRTDWTGVQTFRTFWMNDLSRGTSRFTWTDPISKTRVEFLFMASPKYTNLGGSDWQIDMTLCMFA